MVHHSNVVIEADGGSRGNPGPAGYGAVLKDADTGAVIAEAAAGIGRATNNVAEYRGLIAGLELYHEHAPDAQLDVRMDSKLVIEQMAGRWKIKHPDMRPLATRAQQLAPFGTHWTWVPRELNKHADRLANLAMDAESRGEVYVVGCDQVVEGFRTGTRAQQSRDESRGHNQPGEPAPDALEPPTASTVAKNPMLGWSDLLGTPTTLVFLRHGETIYTADKRFSGPGGADPGLIDVGRAHALRAAERLQRDGRVAAIVASPLRRTRETADIVADAIGLSVTLDDAFRECAFGVWDGLTLAQVGERWPEQLDAWLGSMDAHPPGGESTIQVQARVEEALTKVVASYLGQTVLVVSHVTPIKLAVRYVLDAPLHSINKMLLAPASLTTVSFYESGATSLRQFSALP